MRMDGSTAEISNAAPPTDNSVPASHALLPPNEDVNKNGVILDCSSDEDFDSTKAANNKQKSDAFTALKQPLKVTSAESRNSHQQPLQRAESPAHKLSQVLKIDDHKATHMPLYGESLEQVPANTNHEVYEGSLHHHLDGISLLQRINPSKGHPGDLSVASCPSNTMATTDTEEKIDSTGLSSDDQHSESTPNPDTWMVLEGGKEDEEDEDDLKGLGIHDFDNADAYYEYLMLGTKLSKKIIEATDPVSRAQVAFERQR